MVRVGKRGMRASELLVSDILPKVGLPDVPLGDDEMKELEELRAGFKARMGPMAAKHLPDWFVKKMREKNPRQAFDRKLPFRMTGFTAYGAMTENAIQALQKDSPNVHKPSLRKHHEVGRILRLKRQEYVDTIRRKIEEQVPLTEDEKAFWSRTDKTVFTQGERSAYRKEQDRKVEKAKAESQQPKTSREMRLEVEELCRKYRYSPLEELVKMAMDEDTPRDERMAINKMLLPYTAPTMSSVRVNESAGGNVVVKIQNLEFTPAGPGPVMAPVGDPNNNDVGDAWKQSAGRKTHEDFLHVKQQQVEGESTLATLTGGAMVHAEDRIAPTKP